jgi:hypothetical protein
MAFLTRGLAARQKLFHAFVACSFPIFVWTFYRLFDLLPSWVINLSLWEVIGITAYTLAFSLLESLLVWLLFVAAAALLPRAWLRDRLVVHTTIVVWVTTIWAIAIHLLSGGDSAWSFQISLPGLAAYVLSIVAVKLLLWKVEVLQVWLDGLVRRIAVLASVYILTGLAGMLIVLVRNF